MQSRPQLKPVPVTVPLPVPAFATVSVYVLSVKVAVTVSGLAGIVTVHVVAAPHQLARA